MKVRYLGTLLLAVLTFFGCDDNTGTLGLGMLPDSDGMSAHTTTFNVTTRSFAVDSVFAKTSTGYIGKFSDPEFGYYETSFLTELNCTENFSLPEVYKVTERDSEGNPIKATGTMTAEAGAQRTRTWLRRIHLPIHLRAARHRESGSHGMRSAGGRLCDRWHSGSRRRRRDRISGAGRPTA